MATSGPPILYFGFGAMANSISRKRRDVNSRWQRPAVLKNFCLDFFHGYATITPKSGEEVHGVLMELESDQSWQNLVAFESGYEIIQEEVFPYGQDEPSVAKIFQVPKDEQVGEHVLPQERYLKVVAKGLREHGVEEQYVVDKVLSTKSVPSRKPEDYRRFAEAEVLPTISWDQYQRICKTDAAFILGNRVVQFGTRNLPDHPAVEWMTTNMIGKEDCTWKIWQTLLEPDLPQAETPEELKDIHVRWAEDQAVLEIEPTGIPLPTVRHILVTNDQATENS